MNAVLKFFVAVTSSFAIAAGAYGSTLKPICIYLANLSSQTLTKDGATKAYVGLVKHLAVDKNLLDSSSIKAMIGQDALPDPADFFSREVNGEERHAFAVAASKLSEADWESAKKEIAALIGQSEKSREKRDNAKNETRNIPHTTVVNKKFFPDTISFGYHGEVATKDGNHYVKYMADGIYVQHLESGRRFQIDGNSAASDNGSFFETDAGELLVAYNESRSIKVFNLKSWSVVADIPKELFPVSDPEYGWFEPKIFQRTNGELAILATRRLNREAYFAIDFKGNVLLGSRKVESVAHFHILEKGSVYIAEAKDTSVAVKNIFTGKQIFNVPIPAGLDLRNNFETQMHADGNGTIYLAIHTTAPGKAAIAFYSLSGGVQQGPVTVSDPYNSSRSQFIDLDSGSIGYLQHSKEGPYKIDIATGAASLIYKLGPGSNLKYFKVHRFQDGRQAFIIQDREIIHVIDEDSNQESATYYLKPLGPNIYINGFFDEGETVRGLSRNELVQFYGPSQAR